MSRRLTEAMMEIVKQDDLNLREKTKILMPAAALATFASEIERDLGAPGGSVYPLPYHGFKFMGISFEPCPA